MGEITLSLIKYAKFSIRLGVPVITKTTAFRNGRAFFVCITFKYLKLFYILHLFFTDNFPVTFCFKMNNLSKFVKIL